MYNYQYTFFVSLLKHDIKGKRPFLYTIPYASPISEVLVEESDYRNCLSRFATDREEEMTWINISILPFVIFVYLILTKSI